MKQVLSKNYPHNFGLEFKVEKNDKDVQHVAPNVHKY